MKKVFFWLFVVIAVAIAYRIGEILIFDFDRLTDYGFGYLTGLIIMFLILTGIAILLGIKILKKNRMS